MKLRVGDTVVCKSSHFAFSIDMATGSVSVNDFLDIEINSEGIYKGTIAKPEGVKATGEMAQQFSAISKSEYEVVEVSGKTYATDMNRWETITQSNINNAEYDKLMEELMSGSLEYDEEPKKRILVKDTKEKKEKKEKIIPNFEDEFKKKYELLKRYLGMMGVNEEDAKDAVVKDEVIKITAKYLEINNHNDCADSVKVVFNIIDNIEEFMKDIENLK